MPSGDLRAGRPSPGSPRREKRLNIGQAYLTEDEEIVFTPQSRAIEVVLVAPETGSSGAWAVRLRPPRLIARKAIA